MGPSTLIDQNSQTKKISNKHFSGVTRTPNSFWTHKSLDPYEKEILGFIQSYAYVYYYKGEVKRFSTRYIASCLGRARNTVKAKLESLLKKGHLRVVGEEDRSSTEGREYIPTKLWVDQSAVVEYDATAMSSNDRGVDHLVTQGGGSSGDPKEVTNKKNIYGENTSHDVNWESSDTMLGENLIEKYNANSHVLPLVEPPSRGAWTKDNMATLLGRQVRSKNIRLEALISAIENFAIELRDNHHGKTKKRSIWDFFALTGGTIEHFNKYLPENFVAPTKTSTHTNNYKNHASNCQKPDRPFAPPEMEGPPPMDEKTKTSEEISDFFKNLNKGEPQKTNKNIKSKRPTFNLNDPNLYRS